MKLKIDRQNCRHIQVGNVFVDRDGRRRSVSALVGDNGFYLVGEGGEEFAVEVREMAGDLPMVFLLNPETLRPEYRIPEFFDPQCHVTVEGTETVLIECVQCAASGVYGPLYGEGGQGERDAGVPCKKCYSSGRIIFTYMPFTQLRLRNDIKRVGIQPVTGGPVIECAPYGEWLRNSETNK